MNPALAEYIETKGFTPDRARRMVDGLRVLQDAASCGDRPMTYGTFAFRVQAGLAAQATSKILGDIGDFCNAAGWPNVTCYVISATTGECSQGFAKVSDLDPQEARDTAWFAYAVYKNAPRVDDAPADTAA